MVAHMDKNTAVEIAIRFLKQHFSVQEIDATLEDDAWVATAKIESFDKIMIEKVQVDSVTGRIRGFELR